MLLSFQWHEAQIIYATDTYGTAFAAELRAVSNSAHTRNETGVSFSSVISFQTGNVQSINQAINAMEADGGLIVIILASYGDAVRMVAVEMARRGFMVGAIQRAWHCPRFASEEWPNKLDHPATARQIARAQMDWTGRRMIQTVLWPAFASLARLSPLFFFAHSSSNHFDMRILFKNPPDSHDRLERCLRVN
jgi:hypothetical protein